ncbi:hypothetical protein SAMN04487975_11590 [Planococcus glaciei]|nr:hypothetical protein SAMN04487975_11590 [Planococcus glaciei]
MLYIHCSPSIWSKPAEKTLLLLQCCAIRRKDLASQASANVLPAGQRKRRDSRDPARRTAAEEAWRIARGKRSWFAEYR